MDQNLVSIFNGVRDIPYRIPLTLDEPDDCCTGKSLRLLELLQKNGYEARYRICRICWADWNLPDEVIRVPHDNDSSHMYVEINIDNRWIVLDPTWDKYLVNVLPVNSWNGKSDTNIAGPYTEILSPEESIDYFNHIASSEEITKDLEINGAFYQALNEWLEQQRKILIKE